MTEDEWFKCKDNWIMTAYASGFGKVTKRSATLYALAIMRESHPDGMWEGRREDDLFVIQAAERMAAGEELDAHKLRGRAYCMGLSDLVCEGDAHAMSSWTGYMKRDWERDEIPGRREYPYEPCEAIREFFNPFARPVPKDQQARSLAAGAYENRRENGRLDPFRLCLLADRLEEVGCEDEVILRHLRGQTICPRCLGDCGWWQNCDACNPISLPWDKWSPWVDLYFPHHMGCWAVEAVLS